MARVVQRDELEAMQSIFEGYFDVVDVDHFLGGRLYTYIEVPELKVLWKSRREKNGMFHQMTVQYLPPLILTFQFPPDYPAKSPPKFHLTSQWMTRKQQAKLNLKLIEIWKENEGCEVLFLWANFLKEDSLVFLKVESVLDVTELYNDCFEEKEKEEQFQNAPSLLSEEVDINEKDVKQMVINKDDSQVCSNNPKGMKINIVEELRKFNRMMKKRAFLKSDFTCDICCSEKPGNQGMQFEPCDHAFCEDCLKIYFESCIQEGKVQNIQCPQNCTTVVKMQQIKLLVSEEMFQKYDKLQLKVTLESMSDVIYCPRPICQYPVIYNPEENLAQCPRCEFAFCIHCRKTYHGVETCYANLKHKAEIVKEYQTAKHQRKLELEKLYGKIPLRRLTEEVESEGWKKTNTKLCPKCKASIDRYTGCNRVVCANCQTIFCWLCMQFLLLEDNYNHYFTPNSQCNNRLFLGTDFNEEDEWLEWEEYEDGEEEYIEEGDGENILGVAIAFNEEDYDFSEFVLDPAEGLPIGI